MDIRSVRGFAPYRDKLLALGFGGEDGLEQVLGLTQAAAPELADYLGLRVDQLAAMMNAHVHQASSIPMAAANTISRAVYSLGFAIDQASLPVAAPALGAPVADIPPDVNMVAEMTDIRDQANRGTCVAHAALAAYEHYLKKHGAGHDLSEQFLYWNCKRSDGIPNVEGTYLAIALPLLKRDGCCMEYEWPYVANPIVGNEGQGPPPGGAQLAALGLRINGFKQLSPTYVDDLKAELADGRCVAFSVPVFNSWLRNPYIANSGEIMTPIPNEIRVGGHSMCLVGYVDMPNRPDLGHGRFILRNSWGTNWGINCPYGIGYGTIPYAYLAKLGAEAYSILP